MTTTEPSLSQAGSAPQPGRRGAPRTSSWLPTWDLITTKNMEIRRRRGLISTVAVLIVAPTVVILGLRLLFHAIDPHSYGLADEGRTVMLSSHLLDEVERTCDAVAIVDHGRVIRQGPIAELTRGADAMVVQVDCAEPAEAARLIEQADARGGGREIEGAGIAAGTALTETGLTVTLPAGASRELIAAINRRLVLADIDVYGLHESRASLEEWFLSVTSRLGDPS